MAHIKWAKQKMKVKLAQAFSSSVADALEYCNKNLQLPQFRGCEETVDFLRTIDAAFDVLNSRNPFGKGIDVNLARTLLSPTSRTESRGQARTELDFLMTLSSFFLSLSVILQKAETTLLSLKDNDGKPLHCGKRRTCIIGFIASARSVLNIFHELVEKDNAQCRYLLTYKLSKDQLELFFSSVRARGGFNNNPTTRQFTAAYKRLLVRHQVKAGTGNCLLLDNTNILGVTSASINTTRRFNLEPVMEAQSEHDYSVCPDVDAVSEYKEAAINSIAGFVVKKIKEKHLCLTCSDAITSNTPIHPFILLKNRGGLQKPSEGIVAVCREAERCFQRILKATSGKLPQGHGLSAAIGNEVLRYSEDKTLFPELHSHMFDTTVEDNHVHLMVKMAASFYFTIRLHHLAKRETEKLTKQLVRHKFTKLIHFHHQ
ncbi:hypothetical protein WMY93_033764 [Mugilogobius chulae]|uniref:THAP domain containing 9 n=1 Tax=Mugilogobius chulae TaxID=88201 RepID=A0AAW0MHW0_9GOBI